MLKKIFACVVCFLFLAIIMYGIAISGMVRIFILWLGAVLLIGNAITSAHNKKKYKRPSDRR